MSIVDLFGMNECLPPCDNLQELIDRFYVWKFPNGNWMWTCKKDHSTCMSAEFLCPTSRRFITYAIVCVNCGASWRPHQRLYKVEV
jgi:hypothetical protein